VIIPPINNIGAGCLNFRLHTISVSAWLRRDGSARSGVMPDYYCTPAVASGNCLENPAMRPPAYRTNRLLWFVLSLVCFLFGFDGIYFVIDLFAGRVRIKELASFDFIGPVVFSVVMGWLLECGIVIVWSSMRKKPKLPN
jgi:hypothetical protein